MNGNPTLSPEDMRHIAGLCDGKSQKLKADFDVAYENWKGNWFTGLAEYSSDTGKNRDVPGYSTLLQMGRDILPFLVDRLTRPDEFPALVLYDDLAPGQMRCDFSIEDPLATEGEQARAIRSVKRYIDNLGLTKENGIMPSYTLNTAFDENDLKRFYATGTNIVVAKPSLGGEPDVAWLVYRPLINNTIQWEELYGIYASNARVENGAVLTQLSSTPFPAAFEKSYTLAPSGIFTGPNGGGHANAYTAINGYNNLPQGFLTFGLFQDAMVDGGRVTGNAVSAAEVLYQSTATMTPFTTVYLWTQSQVKSNTVVTTVTSAMTKVVFGGGISEVSLKYDPATGTFIAANKTTTQAITAGSLALEHTLPLLD